MHVNHSFQLEVQLNFQDSYIWFQVNLMFHQLYINFHIKSFKSFYKVNQLMLCYQEFDIMHFWSLFTSIINLVKNSAVTFHKLFVYQDIDIIHEVYKVSFQLNVITYF